MRAVALAVLLAAAGASAAPPLTVLRFDEIIIEPGNTVTLHGMLELALDPTAPGERGYRDGAPFVARLVPAGELAIQVLRVF